jgi:DNA (cytosine-5)-methyltransferase 1
VFFVGCLGDWQCAAAVLFNSESLRGNPPPGRKAREEFAGDVANCIRASGNDPHRADTGNYVTCISHGQANAEICEGYAPTLNCNHEQQIVFGSFHSVAFVESGATLKGGSGARGYPDPSDGNGHNIIGSVAATLVSNGDAHSCFRDEQGLVQQSMRVRRLTPVECARLQGFPDNYLSQVPGASDSAMYKALGNSMAVNCMALLGERMQMVSEIKHERIAAKAIAPSVNCAGGVFQYERR